MMEERIKRRREASEGLQRQRDDYIVATQTQKPQINGVSAEDVYEQSRSGPLKHDVTARTLRLMRFSTVERRTPLKAN